MTSLSQPEAANTAGNEMAQGSDSIRPTGILLVGAGTLHPGTIDNIQSSGLYRVDTASNIDEALNVLRREAYRFRAIIFDERGTKEASKKSIENLATVLESDYPWIRHATGWNVDTSDSIDDLGKLVDNITAQQNDSPESREAPFSSAFDMRMLREAGPLLFSLAWTEEPWRLEADAIVVPTGNAGTMGSLGISMEGAFGGSPPLQLLAEAAAAKPNYSSSTAVIRRLEGSDSNIHPSAVIFATATRVGSTSATIEGAVEACLSAIQLATEIDSIQTLVLPIIGTGASMLGQNDVLTRLLSDFDPRAALGTLAHVIIVVHTLDQFELLDYSAKSDSLLRAQELRNDLPRGDDQLNVKNDLDALADSLAMRDMSPPLVVGILGGWGTGKSFALHLLKERLRKIRCWDLRDKGVGDSFPFVGHIYLIHFDAWTYAKSDLWASLMHKILIDLNAQLAVEETGREYLKHGLDIWALLEGLSTPELRALETEIGATALRSLKSFEPGIEVANSLRRALKTEKRQARRSLADTKRALRTAERHYAEQREPLADELEGLTASAGSTIDLRVTEDTRVMRVALEVARQQLELDEERIRREVIADYAQRAKQEEWNLSKDRLKRALYSGVADRLPDEARGAPAAIASLFDEVWNWQHWLEKQSAQHWFYLVAGLVGIPLIYALLNKLAGAPVWAALGTAAATLSGIATSVQASAKSMREKLETEQKAFDAGLEKRQAQLQQEQAAEMERELKAQALASRDNVESLAEELATEEARVRREAEAEQNKALKRLQDRIEELDRAADREVAQLSDLAEEQERLVGIRLKGPSLHKVIKERVEAAEYDEHLGVVHRVQEDLNQISEALIPGDRHDFRMFPRGKPRIVLVIDDLDRCPPEQVVQVLEAAQLLVKTKLFVVVIGMDVRYVSRALEDHYKGVLVPDGTPSGLDYIEKIIQVPYRVPEIAPDAMKSFLEGQVEVELDIRYSEYVEETGPVDDVESSTAETVFRSSQTPGEYDRLLPESVQVFSRDELDTLHRCCIAAEASPRSAKRLVNVFKLMKIIWFHRGPYREPDLETKKAMITLMALSARQPVVMREVLRDLDILLRRSDQCDQEISDLLGDRLKRSRNQENSRTIDNLTSILSPELVGTAVTLRSMGSENFRLVRSFSFVGETVDEIDASPETSPTSGPDGSGDNPL
ncbi:MAG: hypothetical protein GY785_18790 [Gammaproteobacteria bacterium]|nr:hypothetical protein [Gammaproteobacteria bacterium]